MILRNLIQELNTIIPRASDYDVTNVTGVDYSGGQIIFECGQEELEEEKQKVKEAEDTISGLESDLKNRDASIDELTAQVSTLDAALADFKLDGGETASGLLARVEQAEKSEKNCRKMVQDFKGIYDDLVLDHKKLNMRKNKASVTRCVYTGKLIAEFNGVKYFMEEKK